jgi:hypothetical protein
VDFYGVVYFEVSEKFNTFFSTVADKIGEDIVYDPTTHPSILEIKNHVSEKKILNETKNHNPPPLQVKWSVP